MLKDLLQTRGPLAHRIDGFAIAVGGDFLPIDLAEQSIQKLTDRITLYYGVTELVPIPLWSEFRTKDDLHWFMPTNERLVQVIDDLPQGAAMYRSMRTSQWYATNSLLSKLVPLR
jgi:hypothetical protein